MHIISDVGANLEGRFGAKLLVEGLVDGKRVREGRAKKENLLLA